MKYKLSEYWPSLAVGAGVRFDQTGGTPSNFSSSSTIDFVRDPDSFRGEVIRLVETNNGVWQDDWCIALRPTGDVEEFGDKFVGGRFTQFKPGFGIYWGKGEVAVGDVQTNKVAVSLWLSVKTWPFIGAYADNTTTLEAVLPELTLPNGDVYQDVIQLHNSQRFFNVFRLALFGTKTYERRTWLARGKGVIQTQYLPNTQIYFAANRRSL